MDAWNGDAPRQGDDAELDRRVEAYLSRFHDFAPEYYDEAEDYSDWLEWVDRQRGKFYTDRGRKRLTSSERRERGYDRVRRAS